MQHPPRRIPLSIFQSTSMAAIQKTSYFQPEQDEVQAFGGSSCSILVLFCYFRGHFKTFLGSGLIIPNEVKTGYIEDMEVSHAYPILPFRKPDGTDQPFLSPLSRYPRADDRHVVSGILYVIKHGLQWKDAPAEYGPYKTLYNRFVRLSRLGVFSRIFTELANQTPFDGSLMIDSTHLKARRTAASLRKKGAPRVS